MVVKIQKSESSQPARLAACRRWTSAREERAKEVLRKTESRDTDPERNIPALSKTAGAAEKRGIYAQQTKLGTAGQCD